MIGKEFRALLPAWLACAAVMVAGVSGFSLLRGFEVTAYFIGTGALGALSIGHEYTHRTLGMLLSQPVDRRRVLLTKLGVLAVMLVALLGIAVWTMRLTGEDKRLIGAAILWLPLLVSLFVAPWLTMASRTSIGGAVFSIAIVGMLLLIGQWLGVVRHGYARDADAFQITFLWWALAGLSVVGAVMTWRSFLRLETLDGPSGAASSIRAVDAAGSPTRFTKRNPVWLLLLKELRLQRLALAIAGVYVIGYLVALKLTPTSDGDALTVLTVFYGGLLAILIGALGSAEERQLGTLEWQMLMPMAAWQQWAVKAATVLGLALLLCTALPWLLVSLFPPESTTWLQRSGHFLRASTYVLIVVLTIGALYVSSLSGSGLWALLVSLPAFVGGAIFIRTVGSIIERSVYANLGHPHRGLRSLQGLTSDGLMGVVLLAVLIALALTLALRNHRSADRGAGRAVPQVALLLASASGGFALVLVLGAVLR